MKKIRKKPERTCIVCRSKKEKNDLIRIVRDKDNNFFYDPTGKANGRGAYICKDQECIDKFLKKKFLEKSFKQSINKDVIDSIREEIKEIVN